MENETLKFNGRSWSIKYWKILFESVWKMKHVKKLKTPNLF